MFDTYRESREPWQDTMQVCPNGHVINASFRKRPYLNKDFCDKCGEKTITNCPKCDKPIPANSQGLSADLQSQSKDNLKVIVFINPL